MSQPYIDKRKNHPPSMVIVWGLSLSLVLIMGLIIGLAGALLFGPPLLGLDDTATALQQRARSINATSESNRLQALHFIETQSALTEAEALLDLTATQSSNFLFGTQTAVMIVNAQQGTQAALNFQNTQIALEQRRTQVILDFQATQAALDQNETRVFSGQITPAP